MGGAQKTTSPALHCSPPSLEITEKPSCSSAALRCGSAVLRTVIMVTWGEWVSERCHLNLRVTAAPGCRLRHLLATSWPSTPAPTTTRSVAAELIVCLLCLK